MARAMAGGRSAGAKANKAPRGLCPSCQRAGSGRGSGALQGDEPTGLVLFAVADPEGPRAVSRGSQSPSATGRCCGTIMSHGPPKLRANTGRGGNTLQRQNGRMGASVQGPRGSGARGGGGGRALRLTHWLPAAQRGPVGGTPRRPAEHVRGESSEPRRLCWAGGNPHVDSVMETRRGLRREQTSAGKGLTPQLARRVALRPVRRPRGGQGPESRGPRASLEVGSGASPVRLPQQEPPRHCPQLLRHPSPHTSVP